MTGRTGVPAGSRDEGRLAPGGQGPTGHRADPPGGARPAAGDQPGRPRRIAVSAASGSYVVHVGAGAMELAGPIARRAAPSGRCALIADSDVAALWGDRMRRALAAAGVEAVPASFPAGEANKTRATWQRLTDALLEAGLGRDSCVVALGGGVTGDAAGFVAATYLRGVPVLQVPTTTLAMIDASVGGKTGVDHPLGKNLIGAFHPPCAVLADPRFLATLDRERRAEGFAEALKHGAVADAGYASWLAIRATALLDAKEDVVERAVAESVEIKANVVTADEFEAGRRQVLNFGHTVGHALEAASGYTLPHGQAVAAGMVAEARIGEAAGVTEAGTADEIAAMVRAFGLSARRPSSASVGELAGLMSRDKKTRSGVVHVVLLETLGRVHETDGAVATPLPAAELARVMAEWRT